jgi:hypothetical protein
MRQFGSRKEFPLFNSMRQPDSRIRQPSLRNRFFRLSARFSNVVAMTTITCTYVSLGYPTGHTSSKNELTIFKMHTRLDFGHLYSQK